MLWIAPSKKDAANAALEQRFWDAADPFRANSGFKSQEYSAPVLGLIFPHFAAQQANIIRSWDGPSGHRRPLRRHPRQPAVQQDVLGLQK